MVKILERYKTMTYNKPEIASLGDTSNLIKGVPKVELANFDWFPEDFTFIAPAYDLDE